MKIKKFKLNQIHPARYNPRNISEGNMERLQNSIKEYGLVELLVVNVQTGNTLVAGHQRLKVLLESGKKESECIVVDLPVEKEKALNISLNNENLRGEFDFSKLADLVAELDTGEMDMATTGFDEEELERIANWTPETESETEGKEDPPDDKKKPVEDESRRNLPIWIMEDHRLVCASDDEPCRSCEVIINAWEDMTGGEARLEKNRSR